MPVTAIITLDETKTHVDIDDSSNDAEIDGFILAATALVESKAGPVIQRTVTETHAGVNARSVVLRSWPVLSVTSVSQSVYGTASASYLTADLTLEASGVLRVTNGAWLCGDLTVTYVVGRSEVPPTVRFATLEAVRLLWTKAKGMGSTEYPVSLSDFDIAYVNNLLGAELLPMGVA